MVIFASGLGVIIITEGLFLRRLLGELAELRRQITGIERTMRADRAHVKALRQLLAEDEEDEPPPVAAVIGNGGSPPPDTGLPIRHLPGLLLTRNHLSVLKGGGIFVVLAALADFAASALRAGRGRMTAALAGSAVTATTVTRLTITPWVADAHRQAPPAAPAVTPSKLSAPAASHPPQLMRSQAAPVAATSPPPPQPSPSASSLPTPTLPDTGPDASETVLADEQPEDGGSTEPEDDATATASKSPPGASHTTGPPATHPPRAPGGHGRARGRSRPCSAVGVHGCSARR